MKSLPVMYCRLVAASAILIQIALGAIYAWLVFTKILATP